MSQSNSPRRGSVASNSDDRSGLGLQDHDDGHHSSSSSSSSKDELRHPPPPRNQLVVDASDTQSEQKDAYTMMMELSSSATKAYFDMLSNPNSTSEQVEKAKQFMVYMDGKVDRYHQEEAARRQHELAMLQAQVALRVRQDQLVDGASVSSHSTAASAASSSAESKTFPTIPSHVAKRYENMDFQSPDFLSKFDKYITDIDVYMPLVETQDKYALRHLRSMLNETSSNQLKPFTSFTWAEIKQIIPRLFVERGFVTENAATRLKRLYWYPRCESLNAFFDHFIDLIDQLSRPLHSIRVAMGLDNAQLTCQREFTVMHSYILLTALGKLGKAVRAELERVRMSDSLARVSSLSPKVQLANDASNRSEVKLSQEERIELVEYMYAQNAPHKVQDIMDWARRLGGDVSRFADTSMTIEEEQKKFAAARGKTISTHRSDSHLDNSNVDTNNTNNNNGGNSGAKKKSKKLCSQCPNATHTNDNCWVQHPEKKPARLNNDKPSNNGSISMSPRSTNAFATNFFNSFMEMASKNATKSAGYTPASSNAGSRSTSPNPAAAGSSQSGSSSGTKTPPSYATGAQKK